MPEKDFADVIEGYFPYDGPHSSDTVTDAAHGAAALIRYLNNATRPGNAEGSLESAPTICRVTGGVHSLVARLDQLLAQLAEAMGRQASDPTLYDDRRDRAGNETAREVVERLDDARQPVQAAATALERACDTVAHLGHDRW